MTPFPQFSGQVTTIDSNDFSTYHGMVLQLQQRWKNGVQFQFSYTLAKTLARNPDPKQQRKIIRIVQKKLMDDMPLIPIAYTGTTAATSKRIFGVQAHEIGLPYFQDISFLAAT